MGAASGCVVTAQRARNAKGSEEVGGLGFWKASGSEVRTSEVRASEVRREVGTAEVKREREGARERGRAVNISEVSASELRRER